MFLGPLRNFQQIRHWRHVWSLSRDYHVLQGPQAGGLVDWYQQPKGEANAIILEQKDREKQRRDEEGGGGEEERRPQRSHRVGGRVGVLSGERGAHGNHQEPPKGLRRSQGLHYRRARQSQQRFQGICQSIHPLFVYNRNLYRSDLIRLYLYLSL